jgi:hypothetical protein
LRAVSFRLAAGASWRQAGSMMAARPASTAGILTLDRICHADKSADMNKAHQHFSRSFGTFRRNVRFYVCFAVAGLAGTLAAQAAEGSYYGTVEGFDGNQVVIKTTKHSTGHWKMDAATHQEGSFQTGDWVFAEIEASGHVRVLRFEERPTTHAGVIQKIHNQVLTVHSGPNLETWNLKETTLLEGVAAADLQVGDELGAKLYKNHNLATLRVIKTSVGIK